MAPVQITTEILIFLLHTLLLPYIYSIFMQKSTAASVFLQELIARYISRLHSWHYY